MRIKFIIFMCALVLNATAQTRSETEILSGKLKSEIGYYINPSVHIGEVAGSAAVLPGIGAGVIFNKNLYLGLNYRYIASENTPAGETDNRFYLDQRFYGIKSEFSLYPGKLLHFNFPVELGTGETEYDLKDAYENSGTVMSDDSWFAYLEPGVALELNLWKYAKLDFSAGYRIVSKMNFRHLSGKDFTGFSYSAGLKIGLFRD